MEKSSAKISTFKKAAYGVGSIGESLSYNIFYSFFIYFMTTFAGVRPGIAGTISFVAVAWDAITDPLIGQLSDNSTSKRGRRIPFIIGGCIPLALTVFALFTNPSFSDTGKAIYYVLANIAFWLAFTAVDIPYIALGSEITDDYDERTKVRTWARAFMSVGDIIVIAGTLPLVDKLTAVVGDEVRAWTIVGAIYGVVSAITFFISAYLLRKDDKPLTEKKPKVSFKNVLKEYKQILKIKEYKKIILISLLANLIIGIGASGNIFVWKYTYQFDSISISLVGLVSTLFSMLAVFPASWIATKLGKKQSMATGFSLIAVGLMILYFAPRTVIFAIIAQVFKLSGISVFWTVVFSLNYDIVEIDEFINGTNRVGLLVSLNSFFIKVGVSVGMWFLGIMMELLAIDPTLTQQPASAITNLNTATMIVPICIAIVGVISSASYKVSREKFNLLKVALDAKKEGKEYSVKGFEDILK